MRCVLVLALAICSVTSSGCVYGLIYHHTVTPLTTDFHPTTIDAAKNGEGDTKHLQLSYAGFMWDSNGIGDVAKQLGLQEVHYADLETISVLLGLWTQEWVHVYGR